MNIFEAIYLRNIWNGVESRSGPGSGTLATSHVADELVRLVDELGIESVLDVGCGDGYWTPDLPGYVGVDVAPEAIRLARERHPSRTYIVGDAASIDLPKADLVICRDALQHLPLKDGLRTVESCVWAARRWLLASTFTGGENREIEQGDAYAPDLQAPPFNLGRPKRMVFDGWSYTFPDTIRDPRKHLGLWLLTTG